MDNLGDLTKVLEGLQGAKNILANNITSEVLDQMTDEQRKEYEKALNDPKLKIALKDLEKMTKNI